MTSNSTVRAFAPSHRIFFLLGIGIATLFCGCSTGAVHVTSDPPGAKVHIGGLMRSMTGDTKTSTSMVGTTPCKITSFDVWNSWGGAYAWVVWPDGTQSETQVRADPSHRFTEVPPAVFHFKKPEPIAEITSTAKPLAVSVANASQPVSPVKALGLVRRRVAILVGISKYQHKGKWQLGDLKYASADARSLAEYLKDPRRGAFDKVVLLTEKDATTANIKIALREKLRGVQPEDLVMVFWAGHGSPDPHEQNKLYLITHDTNPEHMAGTAYAMEEFRRDIAAIKAKRVMVMADACHSAGISDPTLGLRGRKDNEIVNSLRGVYVDDEKSKKATARDTGPVRLIFTSCEQGEVSRESTKLGHGVFTHYLLQALNGEADKPGNKTGGNGDGKVSLGEMIEYTRDQVKRLTGNQQHPATAGQFDRTLIMGVVK